jgi:hypothetical protein
MGTVEATTQKVQRMLVSQFNNVTLTEDGFMLREGSTAVSIRIHDFGTGPDGEPSSLVTIWSPVNRDIKPSPELFRWAATEGQQRYFGRISIYEQPSDGVCHMALDHTLLGDFLDPHELFSAVAFVTLAADELDDQIQQRFGGKRFIDT